MSTYEIRPHHGLCIRFFQGKGYSPEFITNMTEIVEKLGENPEIRLVSGGDALCRTCPNRVGDVDCRSDEKVRGYDRAVLDRCGLDYDSVLSWQAFSARVEAEILDLNLRETICGGCQWTDLCKT